MADETGEIRTKKLDPEAEARRQLALAQIRQYPDPVLRMRAREVEEFNGDVAGLAERLTHLLREANGLGLAATQIGVLRRVFSFLPAPEEEPVVIVNPAFTATSDERESDTEGCLSLQGVVIPVERHVSLTVEGKDPEGNDVRLEPAALPGPGGAHELHHPHSGVIFS